MAKKRATKVPATQQEKAVKAVRLDLDLDDFELLEEAAKFRGLKKSGYARQAVLDRIRSDLREKAEQSEVRLKTHRRGE